MCVCVCDNYEPMPPNNNVIDEKNFNFFNWQIDEELLKIRLCGQWEKEKLEISMISWA